MGGGPRGHTRSRRKIVTHSYGCIPDKVGSRALSHLRESLGGLNSIYLLCHFTWDQIKDLTHPQKGLGIFIQLSLFL